MKDPAVLWYYQDFLVGTEFMTDEEVGKYTRILCHQADKGHLTKRQILSICKTREIPEVIAEKLLIDEEGNYYQNRMQIEKDKRNKHIEHQSENAKKRWQKDECRGNAVAMPLLNEDENINENKDLIELYKKVVVFFDEDLRPKTDKQKNDWIDTLDKLIRIDGKTPDVIAQVIKRTRMDDFWRKNFMSIMKLRQKDKNGVQFFLRFEKLFIGENKGPEYFTYNDILKKHDVSGPAVWNIYKPVMINGKTNPSWVHIDDIKKYSLKIVNP